MSIDSGSRPSANAPFWAKMPLERRDLLAWLSWETQGYADPKFGDQRPEHDRHMRETALHEDGFWYLQVFQYVRRAQLLGLDTLQGRQALAKCFAALGGCLESMQRVYGPLPKPGVSSGEVTEW